MHKKVQSIFLYLHNYGYQRPIFQRIKKSVVTTAPNAKLVLFGSYARGTNNDGADVDIDVQSHSGARQMFGLHFIKTGEIDPASGRFLTRLFDLRQTGDFDDFIDFDREKVIELLEPTDKTKKRGSFQNGLFG